MNDTYLWDTPCFDCQPCPAGLYRVGCTGASAGTCIACPDHLRKTDEGQWDSICSTCEICEAGSYRSGCGNATADLTLTLTLALTPT